MFIRAKLLVPILKQVNTVHILTSYFLKIHFNIILLFMPRPSKLCLPFTFLTTFFYTFVSLLHTTYHIHLIFLDNLSKAEVSTSLVTMQHHDSKRKKYITYFRFHNINVMIIRNNLMFVPCSPLIFMCLLSDLLLYMFFTQFTKDACRRIKMFFLDQFYDSCPRVGSPNSLTIFSPCETPKTLCTRVLRFV